MSPPRKLLNFQSLWALTSLPGSLKDPDGLKAFCPDCGSSPRGLERTGRGEREPCASPGVDRWPPQAPGSQVPHLFLGRSEILLALSFSRIDLGPLGASEKVLTHFGFARVFQR